jgi:Protein of unknown function (DUF2795)
MERNAYMSDEPTGLPAETENEGEAEDLAAYLERMAFPADREEILEAAGAMNAPEDVLEEFRKLPAGTRFESAEEAWEAVGG